MAVSYPENENTQNLIVFSIDKLKKMESAFFRNGGSTKQNMQFTDADTACRD